MYEGVGEVARRSGDLAGRHGQKTPVRRLGENGVGTLAPTTTRCKIRLLGLLRDGPRHSWTVLNVPWPGQTRNRFSDRDHLFTGESEGYEEPFERDGTTRRSRGKKWHVVEVGCAQRGVIGTR
ncbi:hypothetical protein CRG98_010733 [Punica granatum]|uniref:Uncharacterized protein n=1 Tax=Punica granatum TaxID=22663 RepID=A0A2I0KK55_PUNGR|nr:hypothetical protein CRG98_010733 [Punica granatum]